MQIFMALLREVAAKSNVHVQHTKVRLAPVKTGYILGLYTLTVRDIGFGRTCYQRTAASYTKALAVICR